MNRAVVLRTTSGLGQYLLAHDAAAARARGVVVGYDGRRLGRELAEDTACVLAALGIPARVTPRPCPTPLLAFAVNDLRAAAGVMVTASHNPPEYNGYKVYWGNGAQIIPPHDEGIAARIAAAPAADPRSPRHRGRGRGGRASCARFGDDVERRYLDAVRGLSVRSGGDRAFPIVYTPLHGVGDRLARMALAEAGFTDVTSVPEQAEPDGAFPTVAFPNPEEKGAIDLAFALARGRGRAAGPRQRPRRRPPRRRRARPDGGLRAAHRQPGRRAARALPADREPAAGRPASASSSPRSSRRRCSASSPAPLGVRYEETLTGFKWIANRAMELERERVRASSSASRRRSATRWGRWCATRTASAPRCSRPSSPPSLGRGQDAAGRARGARAPLRPLRERAADRSRCPGADGSRRSPPIMARLRASPPARIGAARRSWPSATTRPATAHRDGRRRRRPSPCPRATCSRSSSRAGSRVIARPSGTEPKIKFYFDVREPVASGEPFAAAERRAGEKMAALGGVPGRRRLG